MENVDDRPLQNYGGSIIEICLNNSDLYQPDSIRDDVSVAIQAQAINRIPSNITAEHLKCVSLSTAPFSLYILLLPESILLVLLLPVVKNNAGKISSL